MIVTDIAVSRRVHGDGARISAGPRRSCPCRLFERGELDLPAGTRRHLLDPARDDRPQSERLRLGGAEHRREKSAAGLLLRLSDRLAGQRHEQRPRRRCQRAGSGAGAVRALRRRLPDLRPGLPPDDARRGRGRGRRSGHEAPRFDRLFGHRERLAHLSRALQQGPPVRCHRAQPGLADAAADHQERDRGQAYRATDAPRHPARIQSLRAAGPPGRRHAEEHSHLRFAERNRLRDELGQLPRKQRPSRRRDLRRRPDSRG